MERRRSAKWGLMDVNKFQLESNRSYTPSVNHRLLAIESEIGTKIMQHLACYMIYPIIHKLIGWPVVALSLITTSTAFNNQVASDGHIVSVLAGLTMVIFVCSTAQTYFDFNVESQKHYHLASWYSSIYRRIMYQHKKAQLYPIDIDEWNLFYRRFERDCQSVPSKSCPARITCMVNRWITREYRNFNVCMYLYLQNLSCPVNHTLSTIIQCSNVSIRTLNDKINDPTWQPQRSFVSIGIVPEQLRQLDKHTVLFLLFIEWNVSETTMEFILKDTVPKSFPSICPMSIASIVPLQYLFSTQWIAYFKLYENTEVDQITTGRIEWHNEVASNKALLAADFANDQVQVNVGGMIFLTSNDDTQKPPNYVDHTYAAKPGASQLQLPPEDSCNAAPPEYGMQRV